MIYSLVSSLILLLLAADYGLSQISSPGQYPGQYPGQRGPYPGGGMPFPIPGRKTRTNQDSQPTQNFVGVVRKLSTSELVIEFDDKRAMTILLFSSTRYYKSESDADSGNSSRPPVTAKRADFQPGDQVSIDATQDNNGNFRAAKVAMVNQAKSDNGARSSRSADSSSSTTSRDDSDDDRPTLHRTNQQVSGNNSGKQTASADHNQPAATSDRSASDRPVLNRPATTVTPPPPPLDEDDAGQPTLQRGRPTRNSTASADSRPAVVAESRPSLHAEDVNGVTRLPEAPQVVENTSGGRGRQFPQSGDEDEVIAQARDEAFSFSETLPNYVVKQYTTRYATTSARGGRTSWHAIDTVTADVVSEDGKESYKNVLVNGKAPREAVEKTGAWSTGEFSSMQQDILSPATAADFRNKRSTTIVNRSAFRFDFTVEQRNSHWDVHAEGETYAPGYSGAIWIDKASSRVLRIEISAEKIPRAFPLDTVESAIDYDFVLIGDAKYLLPAHSEALSCRRGTGDCTRNVIDFRNYKKFGAETNITFGTDK
jgi:hypothetical protein